VGRTTRKTTEREEFTDAAEIVAEVGLKLRSVPRPDYITLSGSGEPTLHSGIGQIIDGIKRITDVPLAVLTNGSLFYDPQVRAACRHADVILPTLDAGDEETFQTINRPAAGLTLARVAEGLEALRREYSGQIWLEVFLVEGVNSSSEQVRKIGAIAERIKPDRIQLNTAVRPTSEPDVKALSKEALAELAKLLGPKAEVIAEFHSSVGGRDRPPQEAPAGLGVRGGEVLDTIRRRPVTLADIAAGLGIPRETAAARVEELLVKQLITRERRGGKEFYRTKGE
jgi:wyosine [tRNA(Phe)-imidazoG37] synthetase (radical SAM superfamily)